MDCILEVKNLSKNYNEFSLDNLSFSLERGYIMGFIGPNGAGKGTTIKAIMNLIRKDSGQISVLGMDNVKDEKRIKEKIGFVYDENYFYDDLTLLQSKDIISPFYKNWDDKSFQRYIKDFELPLKGKIQNLSKGMKMKFSLALALSHNAELIIMDEPTSGLDPIVRRELLEILYGIIQDEKKGILFSTHNTSDLDKIADYVTFINKGKLVFSCAKEELLENYGIIKGESKLLDNEIKQKLIGIKESRYGFEALSKNSRELKKLLGDKVVVERPNLEDIMLYIVRSEKQCIA